MKFDYSVIRFVPDSFRGEFINIGIIVGDAHSGVWRVRQVNNLIRAKRIGKEEQLRPVLDYIDELERKCENPRLWGDEITLQEEHERLRNLVQLSSPMPIVADNIEAAADQLFDAFVVDLERGTRNTRKTATKLLRTALRSRVPNELVHENVHASVGPQTESVDFAVGNGHLVELAHGWSFRVNEPRGVLAKIIKWSWTIDEVRTNGGTVVLGSGAEYVVPPNIPVAVVYVPPTTKTGDQTLAAALDVFDRLEIESTPTDDVELLVDNTIERLSLR